MDSTLTPEELLQIRGNAIKELDIRIEQCMIQLTTLRAARSQLAEGIDHVPTGNNPDSGT